MEYYLHKQPSAFGLIRLLFYLFASITVVVLVLVVVLNINETASAPTGEIIAKNSPVAYHAPFEAHLQKVLISEGERVQKGDTLAILHNLLVNTTYEKTRNSYQILQNNIENYRDLLQNVQAQFDQLNNQKSSIKSSYSQRKASSNTELADLKKQLQILEQKLALSKQQVDRNKYLLDIGVISQVDYNTSYQNYLTEQQQHAGLQQQYNQQVSNKKQLKNNLNSEMAQETLTTLTLQQEYTKLQNQLADDELRLADLQKQLIYDSLEVQKQYLIATINGTITELSTVKRTTNYTNKGELITRIHPQQSEEFYAKLSIPQKHLSDVQEGQTVHVKLQAYDYYKYGVVKGKIKQIISKNNVSVNEQTPDNTSFQILVNIEKVPPKITLKSGYAINGEVVLAEVKLYEFIFKHLFYN